MGCLAKIVENNPEFRGLAANCRRILMSVQLDG
jgi:hypothetical protein